MTKFVSMFAFMAAMVFGAFTLASCGDDEDDPSSPSEPQASYVQFHIHVGIEHNETTNPFLSDSDAEEEAKHNLVNLMTQELTKIDGVMASSSSSSLYFDDNRRAEVWNAIQNAMDKLAPTMQSQNLYLDGKINCSVLQTFGSERIWGKEFNYTQPSSSFSDNGINYCVINDNEAGVVVKNKNSMGESAYTGDIVIPETVVNNGKTYTITTIGPKAFYSSSITSIVLPKTLTTMYNECFCYTDRLKSITIPASLKNYKKDGSMSSWSIFHESGLTEAVVEEGATVVFDNMFTRAGELKKVVLPSTVTELPQNSFGHCDKLFDITVNGTITNIGEYGMAFTAISDLSAFKFDNATIGKSAFSFCPNLTDIVIPEGVTSLGIQSFANCHSAVSVTIPASVTSMANSVFLGCESLKEFHVKGEKPATLAVDEQIDTFYKVDFAANGVTIYVPAASVEAYKQAEVWSKYADYIKGE